MTRVDNCFKQLTIQKLRRNFFPHTGRGRDSPLLLLERR